MTTKLVKVLAATCSMCLLANPKVLTTIPPYQHIVEQLHPQVKVSSIFNTNIDPHHGCDILPKTMIDIGETKLWIAIGDHFEEKIIHSFSECYPDLKIVVLNQSISHDHCSEFHPWLGVNELIKQSKQIANALCELFPEEKDNIYENLTSLELSLTEIKSKFSSLKGKNIKIWSSHECLRHLCHEFDLEESCIQSLGEDISITNMTNIMQHKDSKNSVIVIVDDQLTSICEELSSSLNISIVKLNTCNKNVIQTLESFLNNVQQSISHE